MIRLPCFKPSVADGGIGGAMNVQQQHRRRMKIMLICVGILFGSIFLFKGFQHLMLKWYLASNNAPVVEVSDMKVESSSWLPQQIATASLRAIQGVNVTTEVVGMVNAIYFTPGAIVKKDTVLVQLNAESDNALLHSLQANAELAKLTYHRDI